MSNLVNNTQNNTQEESNWLIDIVEPIDSKLNYYLSVLPDRLELDIEILFKFLSGRTAISHLEMGDFLSYLLGQLLPNEDIYLYPDEQEALSDCFEFEIIKEPVMDFFNRKISGGELYLIKIRHMIEDKTLYELLEKVAVFIVKNIKSTYSQSCSQRYKDILNIFNKKPKSDVSAPAMLNLLLVETLQDLLRKNKWNIRSTDLANSIGKWIRSYIEDNDQEAYEKLLKLKQLHETGQPLYLDSVK